MPDEGYEIETLPSGEQVRVYNDGRKYLIPSTSPLKSSLEESLPDLQAAAQALREVQVNAIEAKIAAMSDGKEIPPEKRSL